MFVYTVRVSNDELLLAKHSACCSRPLQGLFRLKRIMTEQLTRINMVQQVWRLSSTNAGGLSFYFLMHCDRGAMESAARNADGDSTEGENQPKKNC